MATGDALNDGPLVGIRAMVLSPNLVGMVVAQFLADYGVEVIIVEPPGGCSLRSAAAWPAWARGSRSLSLDLREETGAACAATLAADADVVFEAFRPGVVERLGLDYDTLATSNPRLVYASVTAFGRDGPLADLKGYEGTVLAKIGGFDQFTVLVDRPGPAFPSVPYCSWSAAQLAIQGILAGLFERTRSGTGQRVDTTLVPAIAAHDVFNWMVRLIAKRYAGAFTEVPPVDPRTQVPNSWMSYALMIRLSADGRWLQFSQATPKLFQAFLRSVDLAGPEWQGAWEDEDLTRRAAFRDKALRRFGHEPSPNGKRCSTMIRMSSPRSSATAARSSRILNSSTTGASWRSPTPCGVWCARWRRSSPCRTRPAEPTARCPNSTVTTGGRQPGRKPSAMPRHPPTLSDAAPPRANRGLVCRSTGSQFSSSARSSPDPSVPPFSPTSVPASSRSSNWTAIPSAGNCRCPRSERSRFSWANRASPIDINRPEGQELVREIATGCDVALVTFRAGVAARIGLDEATLRASRPDIIYHTASGFGTTGPYAHRPAYAPTIGAGSGMARRNVGSSVPERADLTLDEVNAGGNRLGGANLTMGHADGFSGIGVATGLLLGLLARARGYGGQSVATTMLSTMSHVLSEDMIEYEGRPHLPVADTGLHGFGALYRLYETADGWVFLAVTTQVEWLALTRVMGKSTITHDARFESPRDDRSTTTPWRPCSQKPSARGCRRVGGRSGRGRRSVRCGGCRPVPRCPDG